MNRLEKTIRWTLLITLVFAIILVPFLIIGAPVEAWADRVIAAAEENKAAASAILFALLAVDVIFPVPSSVVSVAGGALLGWIGGFLLSFAGMTATTALGYWLGRRFGRGGARKLVGDAEVARMTAGYARFGDWIVALFRAVPMLAEASVLFAGMSQMPRRRYYAIASLANAGVSGVYATVGAFSANINSFVFAFVLSLVLPGVAMLLARGVQAQQQVKAER